MASHRRFFVHPDQIDGYGAAIVGRTARQIARVLRMREGDTVTLLDGSGREYDAELTSVSADEVKSKLIATRHGKCEPHLRLTLAMCVPKGDKMDGVVQKCTELGISRIVAVQSERSVARLDAVAAQHRLTRWRRIATEAAEQSGRSQIPEVVGILSYADLVSEIADQPMVLLAWEAERTNSLKTALEDYNGGPIMLVIGPEGGLTEREVDEAVQAGARRVSLGRRNLRCETAAVAGCAAIMFALEGEL